MGRDLPSPFSTEVSICSSPSRASNKYLEALPNRSVFLAVTNYAKKSGVTYIHEGRPVNLSLAYKDQLRAYSKRQFDPFNRRERIVFPVIDIRSNPKAPTTTIGGEEGMEIKLVFPEEAKRHEYPKDSVIHSLVTTVCQLNFFKFAIDYGVLEYAKANKVVIEKDMINSTRVKSEEIVRWPEVDPKKKEDREERQRSVVQHKAALMQNVRFVMTYN